MALLDDHRIAFQKAALAAELAARADRGQITGYLDYATQLKLWLDRISDGSPLTVPTMVEGTDRAALTSLIDLLTTAAVDLLVQEQIVQELSTALQSHREQVLRQSRGWDPQLDILSSTLDGVHQRFQNRSMVTVTEPFTGTTTGILGQSAVIDDTRGLLSLRPETFRRATASLHRATVTIYPAQNPRGGVHHAGPDDLDPDQHPRALVDGPGFERWILSDIPPSVAIDGTTYEGTVALVDLLYEGSVTFTAIEINSRGTYPLAVVRVQARSNDVAAWLDVLGPDDQPVTGLTDGIYWIHGLPRTTASQVRVWLVQSHAESRTPVTSLASTYHHALSRIEQAASLVARTPGGAHALYVMGLYRLHLLDLTYPSLGTGVFWSHDPTGTDGYGLDQEPIETVSVMATLETPEQSTIEWWIRDVDRGTMIPTLPMGTTRIRERVRLLSVDDLSLTFPIARGALPQVFVNGLPLDHQQYPLQEVNSTRFRNTIWSPSWNDVATVEYTPAIGQTVMVYIVQSRTSDTITIRGALTTANAIFPSRAEADRAIAETTDPSQLESYGVLARLDEFDTWFNGGTLEDNTGHTGLTIPTVVPHPDLQE